MSSRRVCSVCCQSVAQYTCPRCHKAYCTAACYKQHSHQCTEAFYREQATSQLKATRADAEQQRQMLEVLQRLHQQHTDDDQLSAGVDDSSSDGSTDDSDAPTTEQLPPALQQLIAQAVREGDAFDVHQSQLTPDLLAELEQLSLQGRLSHLVPVWQTWWSLPAAAQLHLNATGQAVVVELPQQPAAHTPRSSSSSSSSRSQASNLQQVPPDDSEQQRQQLQHTGLPAARQSPLPKLSVLAGPSVKPSPLLPWQLLQLLVAYAAVMRWYNGEPEASGWEAAQQLLLLSPPLTQPPPAQKQTKGTTAGGDSSSTTTTTAAKVQQCPLPASMLQPALAPPESVRVACMQLVAAAAQLPAAAAATAATAHPHTSLPPAVHPAVPAAAVPAELRQLLQVSTADALRLLQLGRAAVVLALSDTERLLDQGWQQLKLQLQQWGPAATPGTAGGLATLGAPGCTNPQLQDRQQKRQLKALSQQLFLAGRKVLFFAAWSNEQPAMTFEGLALELQLELQEQQDMQAQPAGLLVSCTQQTQLKPHSRATSAPPSRPQQQQQHQQTGVTSEAMRGNLSIEAEQETVAASVPKQAGVQLQEQQQSAAAEHLVMLTTSGSPRSRMVKLQHVNGGLAAAAAAAAAAAISIAEGDLYGLD